MVDDSKIALTPAVEISYLNETEQRDLLSVMESDEVTPSLSQAQRLHRLSQECNLSDNEIVSIMSEVKGNQKEYVNVPTESIKKYFHKDTSVKQMADTIVRAVEYYNRYLERRGRDRDGR